MEIFGIGPFELAMIALIAFIFLGPERIPGVMRQLGRAIRQMRKMTQDLTREYGGELNEITSAVNEVQSEIRGVQRDLNQAARGVLVPPIDNQKIGEMTKSLTASVPTPPTPAAPAAPAESPAVEPPPSTSAKTDEPPSDIIDYRADR